MKTLSSCLWFDKAGLPAAEFYISLFKNSKIVNVSRYGEVGQEITGGIPGEVMVVNYMLMGSEFMNLNGGPDFKHTQAFSNFVSLKNEADIERIWKALSPESTVRMALDKYDWSAKYGWIKDRFGIEWQLMFDPEGHEGIFPAFLFTDKLFGQGEAAINYYTGLFPHSKITSMYRDEKTNTVMYASFKLNDKTFVLMEGPGDHSSSFSEAYSITVPCKDQKEIDFYWNEMTKNGGIESQCGWLKDKFGVSWQIQPEMIDEIMTGKNSDKAFAAMLQMKKMDLEKLKAAVHS